MKTKEFKLDEEETQILDDINKGLFKSVKNLESEKKRYAEIAKHTIERIKKEKNVNIRLTSRDLDTLKSKATKSGLPYQTLVGILIRQYNEGKIEIKI